MSADDKNEPRLLSMDTGGTMTDILNVDAVPVGYPVLRNFEPDTDAFCVGWLGKKAPDRR